MSCNETLGRLFHSSHCFQTRVSSLLRPFNVFDVTPIIVRIVKQKTKSLTFCNVFHKTPSFKEHVFRDCACATVEIGQFIEATVGSWWNSFKTTSCNKILGCLFHNSHYFRTRVSLLHPFNVLYVTPIIVRIVKQETKCFTATHYNVPLTFCFTKSLYSKDTYCTIDPVWYSIY